METVRRFPGSLSEPTSPCLTLANHARFRSDCRRSCAAGAAGSDAEFFDSSYTKKKIPRNLVTDFYETNSRCSQPAVVFITRRKLLICTNPAEKWVQDYMNHLKVNRTVSTTQAY
ncbi:hypothetical protein E2320_018244 [Naja naja]|nr:hypothetical protein E2320_018244 [Naja naja]